MKTIKSKIPAPSLFDSTHEYSIKDMEIKKSAWHDQRAQVDNVIMKVETDAER